jgi:hypothetical protein
VIDKLGRTTVDHVMPVERRRGVRRFVRVPAHFRALHCWPAHPQDPSDLIEQSDASQPFPNTGFLRYPHRHVFHV